MPFLNFSDRRRRERIAHGLYIAIVEQARRPEFYVERAVPDTLDGRFDLIVLHAFLVLHRLKSAGGKDAKAVSQAVFDLMFADMDQNLREMGIGDMGIGKRVKQMTWAFYGRVTAYEEGLADAVGDTLAAALARNLYGSLAAPPEGEVLAAMAAYLRRQVAALAAQDDAALLDGRVGFGDVIGHD